MFTPQRSLNVDCYTISPDLNFILLYECEHDDSNGTKYYVYEVFSTTFYALTLKESKEEVELQKILWSPASYDRSSLVNNNNNNRSRTKVLPSSKSKVKTVEKSRISQAIAFIHNYDIYYKPKIHSDLVIRVTANGKLLFVLLLYDHRRPSKWKSFFLEWVINWTSVKIALIIDSTIYRSDKFYLSLRYNYEKSNFL